jgi:hypothetical protein
VLIGERNQPLDRHASTHLPIHAMADNVQCAVLLVRSFGHCGCVRCCGGARREDY